MLRTIMDEVVAVAGVVGDINVQCEIPLDKMVVV